MHAADRARVEVDLDQRLVRAELEIEEQALGRAVGETAAHGEDHVRRFQGVLRGAPVRQDAEPERIGLGDRAAPHHGRDHRRPEPAREGLELPRRLGRDHPAAGDEERPPSPGEVAGRLLHQPDVARRAPALAGGREPRRDGRVEQIGRDRQRDRAGPAGPEQVERALDRAGDLRAAPEGVGPPADRPEALDLVRHLVERAHVLADQRAGDVRHEEKHGLRARVGLDERCQRVGRARPGRHHDDPGSPRRAGVAVRHEPRALLVPRQDVGDPVLAEEGVVDREVVDARDAEDVAHALGVERGHDPLAASARRGVRAHHGTLAPREPIRRPSACGLTGLCSRLAGTDRAGRWAHGVSQRTGVPPRPSRRGRPPGAGPSEASRRLPASFRAGGPCR